MSNSKGAGSTLKEPTGKKANKSTSTPPELMLCPKCNGNSYPSDIVLVEDYIKCINYINSCHSVINLMVKKKGPLISVPDIPNFLSVLGLLNDQKDTEKYFLVEKGLESDKSRVASDDERTRKRRTSSIPRLVKNVEETVKPAKSAPGNRKSCNNLEEIKKRARTTLSAADYKRSASLASANLKPLEANDSGISQQDLDKFANEILGGYITPNTTISTDSRSPSPKNRKASGPKITTKISYKTKSELSLKCVAKSKGKPNGKAQKKRSITICEPAKPTNAAKQKSQSKRGCENMSPKVSPCKLSQRKPPKAEKPKCRCEKGDEKLAACDNSDIEPDDVHQLNLMSVRNAQKKKAEAPQYVVKEKPIDFFTKRRQSFSPSASEAESDANVKEFALTESDIDEDVFDDVCVDKRYNHKLKISPSRALPKAILSNIGILTNSGKVKPERQAELDKLRSNRAQDAQNNQFRQPRDTKDLSDVMKLPRERSPSSRSHSSDIKSDEEEEICTHRMDVSFKRKY